MQNIPLGGGLEAVLQAYHHYCGQVSGLASDTCARRLERARAFLTDLTTQGSLPLAELSATAVLGYLGKASAICSPQSLPSWISGVRCFLRFLELEGLTPLGLSQVLLSVARPATDPPPKHLSDQQQKKLLDVFDRRAALGRRDYAIVVGLAHLGLRAGEIARVTLEDVDWEQGTLCVRQTKSRRARLLPLPHAVGEAWVSYLRHGRPPTALRELFVSGHQLPRALRNASVSSLVKRAVARAGLSLPCAGAHLLRHTVATRLVQKGASLKAVADLLGHQQLGTTTRYAKVNRSMLAEVAQPWPEVHS